MAGRWGLVLGAVAVLAAACTGDGAGSNRPGADPSPVVAIDGREAEVDPGALAAGQARDFGPAPATPVGDWSSDIIANLTRIVGAVTIDTTPAVPLDALVATGDARLAWPLADILRFAAGTEGGALIQDAINDLTGTDTSGGASGGADWTATVDHLTAWDLPVPDQYISFKHDLYTQVDARWGDLLDPDAAVDWRHVAWGGVFLDDRPLGSTARCSCIPALDDPPVTPASEGGWYPDDRIVFGLVVGDEARAYPKNIMEVHEMVNDTLGGRRIGMPYCTLCGSAQAYYTDTLVTASGRDVTGEHPQPVLRTSGLLIRSNKMMYDLETKSFIDTFLGVATSGPLAEDGVVLTPLSVVTTTWGQWKEQHPHTTIVAADGGRDRTYDLDPLGGRDDNGPIFPIGGVDPRLPVQEPVLGVITDDGRPLAIHVAAAIDVLAGGANRRLVVDGIEIRLDGDGLRAERGDGTDAGGHQAFWFAWSQFRPDTALWPHDHVDPAG